MQSLLLIGCFVLAIGAGAVAVNCLFHFWEKWFIPFDEEPESEEGEED